MIPIIIVLVVLCAMVYFTALECASFWVATTLRRTHNLNLCSEMLCIHVTSLREQGVIVPKDVVGEVLSVLSEIDLLASVIGDFNERWHRYGFIRRGVLGLYVFFASDRYQSKFALSLEGADSIIAFSKFVDVYNKRIVNGE